MNKRYIVQSIFRSIFGVLAFTSVGCASMTGAKTDRLMVTSNPSGAQILVNGAVHGQTPGWVELSKEERNMVQVSAPGYAPTTCNTATAAKGGYVAADVALCIFLFPFGCVSFIDAGGAWNELKHPSCDATLAPSVPVPTTLERTLGTRDVSRGPVKKAAPSRASPAAIE